MNIESKIGVTAVARLIFENLPDIEGDEADWLFYKEDLETAARQIINLLTAANVVLEKRPVAFRIKISDEWNLFAEEDDVRKLADLLHVDYEGLYAREITP